MIWASTFSSKTLELSAFARTVGDLNGWLQISTINELKCTNNFHNKDKKHQNIANYPPYIDYSSP